MAKKIVSTEVEAGPSLTVPTVQETAVLPIRVGMHVLGPGPTDGRVMRAATALVKAGYAVTLVDTADEEGYKSEEEVRGISLKHVKVSRSFSSTRFDRWAFVRIALIFARCTLRLIQTPADIYHAHDVAALPMCYLAAWLRRKPIVYEAHEMPLFERTKEEMGRSRRVLHKILTILLAYIIPRCAGIITVSPPIVEEIRRRYHVPEVALIRSVPEYRAVAKSDRLRQHLNLKPEVRIALYQGNLQRNRGLDRLVRTAAFLEQDTVIVLMGKDVKGMRAGLEALIASEGMADRVKIIPAVPYAELLDWTASADIGLNVASAEYSLNVRYFLPNKLFEYLMAGLPVLTSPLEAMVEVVQTYEVGQVLRSLEPADIGEAINTMLADPAELARERKNALDAAMNELHWEKESLRLLDLYQGICQKRVRKTRPDKRSDRSH